MTNTSELEASIKRAGISKRELAKRLKISEMALYNKIHNIAEFKASEIEESRKALNLSCSQRDIIFFGL